MKPITIYILKPGKLPKFSFNHKDLKRELDKQARAVAYHFTKYGWDIRTDGNVDLALYNLIGAHVRDYFTGMILHKRKDIDLRFAHKGDVLRSGFFYKTEHPYVVYDGKLDKFRLVKGPDCTRFLSEERYVWLGPL